MKYKVYDNKTNYIVSAGTAFRNLPFIGEITTKFALNSYVIKPLREYGFEAGFRDTFCISKRDAKTFSEVKAAVLAASE